MSVNKYTYARHTIEHYIQRPAEKQNTDDNNNNKGTMDAVRRKKKIIPSSRIRAELSFLWIRYMIFTNTDEVLCTWPIVHILLFIQHSCVGCLFAVTNSSTSRANTFAIRMHTHVTMREPKQQDKNRKKKKTPRKIEQI